MTKAKNDTCGHMEVREVVTREEDWGRHEELKQPALYLDGNRVGVIPDEAKARRLAACWNDRDLTEHYEKLFGKSASNVEVHIALIKVAESVVATCMCTFQSGNLCCRCEKARAALKLAGEASE